jgi:hypothetical protein
MELFASSLAYVSVAVWLIIVIYMVTLALRLVKAVERIADSLEKKS